MTRCPNCKARYKGGEHCHRCGMELNWLLNIEKSAQVLRSTLVKSLADADYQQTKKLVRQHQQLISHSLIDNIALFLNSNLNP